MSQDACTLNADSSLKDASDIKFYNDPDDDVLLPPVPSTESMRNAFSILLNAGHTPATVAAGSWRSGCPSKPSARVRDADNAYISPLNSDNDEDIPASAPDPGESSSNEMIPQPDDDETDDKSENEGATQSVHTTLDHCSSCADTWI
ncbi:uncharacterized protein EDB91DRAFT_1245289 [Suillus paluster]|uniref:uncharacterized protein n=1 Tax=Suillus paluster TaxID=48578 RepID=UPI001B86329C|nr:uncharacterized protein EDB91DRAFT_1245289 [Suillus paluster]KAG1747805.1 hypothetical protein EDB91DRAFT_1245289 [Suillus paluster]